MDRVPEETRERAAFVVVDPEGSRPWTCMPSVGTWLASPKSLPTRALYASNAPDQSARGVTKVLRARSKSPQASIPRGVHNAVSVRTIAPRPSSPRTMTRAASPRTVSPQLKLKAVTASAPAHQSNISAVKSQSTETPTKPPCQGGRPGATPSSPGKSIGSNRVGVGSTLARSPPRKLTAAATSDAVLKDVPTPVRQTAKEKLSSDELTAREMEAKRMELQKIKDQNARHMDRIKTSRTKQMTQQVDGPENSVQNEQQPSPPREQGIIPQKVRPPKTSNLGKLSGVPQSSKALASEATRSPSSNRSSAATGASKGNAASGAFITSPRQPIQRRPSQGPQVSGAVSPRAASPSGASAPNQSSPRTKRLTAPAKVESLAAAPAVTTAHEPHSGAD